MSTLCVSKQGAIIGRQGERITVRYDRKNILDLPYFKVRQIFLFGNISISPVAVGFLLSKGLDIVFLNMAGKYKGRLLPAPANDVTLRQQQFAWAGDQEKRLEFSRAFIFGKVANMIVFCSKQRWSRQNGVVQDRLNKMTNTLESILSAENRKGLRGYEGVASRFYFEIFKEVIQGDFRFTKRVKHPPTDPVNVLLSLGYTLLFNNFVAIINAVGLDPFQGFFHDASFGHAALASDLMEEFRAVMVDPLVLGMIRRKEIRSEHFNGHGRQIKLNEEGLKNVLTTYQKRLEKRIEHPETRENLTHWQCLEYQVRHLARCLQAKEEQYTSFQL